MARCWSCGTHFPGGARHMYTCPHCGQLDELKGLRTATAKDFDDLARIQEHGFEALSDRLSTGLSEIASALEWGFEELGWRIHEQTNVLKSIEHTLQTPYETQAKDLRLMAEELRNRGELEESLRRFLRAMELNPLDYRTYVGLAYTYLGMERFGEARSFLEKSLSHAPKGLLNKKTRRVRMGGEWMELDLEERTKAPALPPDFDYRSYSYRLIGRIYFCEEEYSKAVEALGRSIDLSPKYDEGHYDYAQYSALVENRQGCLTSLQTAIIGKPIYHRLAENEKNFEPLRMAVRQLLTDMRTKALQSGQQAISESEDTLAAVRKSILAAEHIFQKARVEGSLRSSRLYAEAKSNLDEAKTKLKTGDYVSILKARDLALDPGHVGAQAGETAIEEQRRYAEIHRQTEEDRSSNRAIWTSLAVCLLIWLLSIVACLAAEDGPNYDAGFGGIVTGLAAGVLTFVAWMVWSNIRDRQ